MLLEIISLPFDFRLTPPLTVVDQSGERELLVSRVPALQPEDGGGGCSGSSCYLSSNAGQQSRACPYDDLPMARFLELLSLVVTLLKSLPSPASIY